MVICSLCKLCYLLTVGCILIEICKVAILTSQRIRNELSVNILIVHGIFAQFPGSRDIVREWRGDIEVHIHYPIHLPVSGVWGFIGTRLYQLKHDFICIYIFKAVILVFLCFIIITRLYYTTTACIGHQPGTQIHETAVIIFIQQGDRVPHRCRYRMVITRSAL